MEDINCILCGTMSDRVLIEQNGYKGKICPNCGLVYISPRPSPEEIAALYEHDSANLSADSHISNAASKKINAKHHLKIVRRFARGGDLLEIGAGAGYFLDQARRKGYSPFGLELNPIQARFIKDEFNIECEQSSIHASIFSGRKFDIVYHCDVMSHFYDPILEFKRIREVMKRNSLLVFETGYVGDVKYHRYAKSFQYPEHLFFFSEGNLKKLLQMTGFRLIKIYRYSLLPELILLRRLRSIAAPGRKDGKGPGTTSRVSMSKRDTKGPSRSKGTTVGVKTLPKRILGYMYRLFRHVLRYKVGRISAKRGRPQTFIVVASRE